MIKTHTYRLSLIAGGLVILSACGNSKRLAHTPSKPSTAPSKAPTYEHEALGNTKSPWKVTDKPEPKEAESSDEVGLYDFIDEWEGTPHVMGGNTLKGVDCSGFVIQCYLQVYKTEFIGRRAEDLFGESTPVKRKDLREGDMVFFKINGRRIDHVGIYLGNGDFVHASSSRGVMISNLSEAYYDKRFFMGGRKSQSS